MSPEDIKKAIETAYREGYDDGYDRGCDHTQAFEHGHEITESYQQAEEADWKISHARCFTENGVR